MGVIEAKQDIHKATQMVRAARDHLRKYLDTPMHGQVPDWEDVLNERRLLDEEITAFDDLLRDGMDQERPKPEPAPK